MKYPRKIYWVSEGQGFIDSMNILDGGRISIAALWLGMAQGAFEAALKYSKERKQFGKPISEFQARFQWKLADLATEIDAARLLTMRAAAMKDAGMKTTLESSMAKLYTSEVAVRARMKGADSRRLRLHQGLSGGEVLPRRKAVHHRRRHQRDPAAGNRAGIAER